MREARVETALVRGVKRARGEVRKLVWVGRRHAPDRLVILPCRHYSAWGGARIFFIELKAPGKKARAGQAREHRRLRKLGCDVQVIDTLEGVEQFLRENC